MSSRTRRTSGAALPEVRGTSTQAARMAATHSGFRASRSKLSARKDSKGEMTLGNATVDEIGNKIVKQTFSPKRYGKSFKKLGVNLGRKDSGEGAFSDNDSNDRHVGKVNAGSGNVTTTTFGSGRTGSGKPSRDRTRSPSAGRKSDAESAGGLVARVLKKKGVGTRSLGGCGTKDVFGGLGQGSSKSLPKNGKIGRSSSIKKRLSATTKEWTEWDPLKIKAQIDGLDSNSHSEAERNDVGNASTQKDKDTARPFLGSQMGGRSQQSGSQPSSRVSSAPHSKRGQKMPDINSSPSKAVCSSAKDDYSAGNGCTKDAEKCDLPAIASISNRKGDISAEMKNASAVSTMTSKCGSSTPHGGSFPEVTGVIRSDAGGANQPGADSLNTGSTTGDNNTHAHPSIDKTIPLGEPLSKMGVASDTQAKLNSVDIFKNGPPVIVSNGASWTKLSNTNPTPSALQTVNPMIPAFDNVDLQRAAVSNENSPLNYEKKIKLVGIEKEGHQTAAAENNDQNTTGSPDAIGSTENSDENANQNDADKTRNDDEGEIEGSEIDELVSPTFAKPGVEGEPHEDTHEDESLMIGVSEPSSPIAVAVKGSSQAETTPNLLSDLGMKEEVVSPGDENATRSSFTVHNELQHPTQREEQALDVPPPVAESSAVQQSCVQSSTQSPAQQQESAHPSQGMNYFGEIKSSVDGNISPLNPFSLAARQTSIVASSASSDCLMRATTGSFTTASHLNAAVLAQTKAQSNGKILARSLARKKAREFTSSRFGKPTASKKELIPCEDIDDLTQLHEACRKGAIDEVEALLDQGDIPVDSGTYIQGISPLHVVMRTIDERPVQVSMNLIKVLLNARAAPDKRVEGPPHGTPLEIAMSLDDKNYKDVKTILWNVHRAFKTGNLAQLIV